MSTGGDNLPAVGRRFRDGDSALGDTQDVAHGRRGFVTYRLGGREYTMVTAPNCKVCNSDARVAIENEILKGRGWKAIWRSLHPRMQEELTVENIRVHYASGHLPAEASVVRVMTEERAREVGALIDETEGSIVNHLTLVSEVVRRTFERIVGGEISPDVDDGLTAAKILVSLGMNEGSEIDTAVWWQAIREMMTLAKDVMTPEQFVLYSERLVESPVLQSIRQQFNAAADRVAINP